MTEEEITGEVCSEVEQGDIVGCLIFKWKGSGRGDKAARNGDKLQGWDSGAQYGSFITTDRHVKAYRDPRRAVSFRSECNG